MGKTRSQRDAAAKALAVLEGAMRQKRPWKDVARALRQLEQHSLLDENGQPWIKRAEALSGYSSNQLRRMINTLQFVEAMQENDAIRAEKLEQRLFSHLEVIAKIWASDATKATALLNEAPPWSTFRDLLAIYDDVKRSGPASKPVSAGKTAARAFADRCFKWLTTKNNPLKAMAPLESHIIRPTLPLHYANPDFLVFSSAGNRLLHIDAVDCHAIHGRLDPPAAERRAVQIGTESTFFSSFWVIVPTSEAAAALGRPCHRLGLDNVSVVTMDLWERHEHSPRRGGSRERFWLNENRYQLARILETARIPLSLTQ